MVQWTLVPRDPEHPDAAALIAELNGDLAARYPGDDGAYGYRPEHLRGEGTLLLVAYTPDGKPAACGGLRPLPTKEGVAEMKRMYTRPACRRQGASLALLRTLERAARQFDYARVQLETGVKQPEAMALYEREGYTTIPCWNCYGGQTDEDSVCYAKDLSAAGSATAKPG